MNAQQRRAHRKLKRRYYDSLIVQKSHTQTTSYKTVKFYRKKGLNISEEYHRMPEDVTRELIASYSNSDQSTVTYSIAYGTNDFTDYAKRHIQNRH